MYKYLVVLYVADDSNTYVLEAENDNAAVELIEAYLGPKNASKDCILSLSRITGGLQIQEIVSPLPIPQAFQDTQDWVRFISPLQSTSKNLFSQAGFKPVNMSDLLFDLQPFDSEVRKKRLEFIKRVSEEQKNREKKAVVEEGLAATIPIPKVGDEIYVPYENDEHAPISGGLARISSINAHHVIEVQELPGFTFSWSRLALVQGELKAQFGNTRAGRP